MTTDEKDDLKRRMTTFITEGGSYVELCEEFIDETAELLPTVHNEMSCILQGVDFLSDYLDLS